MSKLLEQLKTINIFNSYDMASDGMPVVEYHGNSYERFSRGSRWSAYFKNRKLKESAWYENGGKDFNVGLGVTKEQALEEAMALVKKIRPDVEMVKSPFRMTYVAKTDLELATKKLKEKDGQATS